MFIKAASIGPTGVGRKGAGALRAKQLWMFRKRRTAETVAKSGYQWSARPERDARWMEQAMRVEEVLNQSPPYVDVDLYASDRPLQSAVAANGGARDAAALSAFGKHWGRAEMFDLARAANANPPELKTFDAKGFRLDVVEFHPA